MACGGKSSLENAPLEGFSEEQRDYLQQLIDQLDSIHFWHHEVEQDHVGNFGSDRLEGVDAILGLNDLPPFSLKNGAKQLSSGIIVLDEQRTSAIGRQSQSA